MKHPWNKPDLFSIDDTNEVGVIISHHMFVNVCVRIPKIAIFSLAYLLRSDGELQPGRRMAAQGNQRADGLSVTKLIGIDRRTVTIASMIRIRTLIRACGEFNCVPDRSLPIEPQLLVVLGRPRIVEFNQLR